MKEVHGYIKYGEIKMQKKIEIDERYNGVIKNRFKIRKAFRLMVSAQAKFTRHKIN